MYYGNPSANSTSDGAATFETFDDFEQDSSGWTTKQDMLGPKADGTAAVYNGRLYVFGGYSQGAGDARSETYEYNPLTNTWTVKANMPTARWGLIAVEFNGKIFVFGGQANWQAVNVNQVYDPATNTWTTKTNMPSGFNQGLMAVRYGDKIHLFYPSLHYEYDPATDTYTAKTPMPTSRIWATIAVVNNKIYIIGGYHITNGASNVNEVYDPATNSWTTKSPMPVSKYGATRENPVINGKIYVTHGLANEFRTDNYMYDPSTDSWQQKASATYPRDGVECGVINSKLYVVGGRADYNGPYGVKNNEEYDPSLDKAWLFSDPTKVKRDMSAKYEGKYGLTINDDNSNTQYAEHLHNLPTLALDVWWDMTDALGVTTRQPQGRIMLVDPSLANYGSLYFYNDAGAKFKWYTGTFTTLQSGNWNTWHHITIVWNGARSNVIIDGAEYSVSARDAQSSRIRLEASWAEKSKMYFDLVRVRRYSSPEPTAISGDEESLVSYEDKYIFTVASNSTISALAFNSTRLELSFTATGPSGTTGFTKVTIAKTLVTDIANLKVYVDGQRLQYSIASTVDSWIVSFSYTHSAHYIMLTLNPALLRGDVNDDGRVNMLDVSIVAAAFGTRPTDARWNSAADMDNNGIVNIVDISIVACEYGEEV
jgi:N-acetylneuraminic acid mutarotase